MKKFAIKSVVAAVSALSAMAAQAQVNIDANPIVPAVFANEIVASVATPTTLTNVGGAISVQSAVGYGMSDGEVRYVRLELANATWTSAAVAAAGSGNIVVGTVNGIGTSVIYFSITAQGGATLAADTLTVNGNRAITGTGSNVTVSYSLYDQPSQAQAGGSVGRIVDKANRAYINFAKSHQLAVVTDSYVANVEANPAFSQFLNSPANTSNSTTLARLASLDYKLATTVPFKANGTAITLADLMATGTTGTKLVVTGDFSAAANANGTYTGAALNRVYLSTGTNCAAVSLAASAVTATTATFNVGATATTANPHLCFAPLNAGATNGVAIPAATYTADVNAVTADAAVYTVAGTAGGQVSSITRNGTELQAPLVQTTSGFVSRFFLTNTGTVAANFTVRVLTETGNTATLGTLSTTSIPAGGSLEIPVSSVVTGWTTAPRGTVIFTVARPTNQIQGAYQIVNQTSGAVSNMAMIRPGTN